MPDLSHLWQRFLLATALLFGLALGVAATVFGYSNTTPVSVGWSLFRLEGIPLWTVTLVPLVIVLVAGTVYHWFNSFHHFTEHMRHRRRVHELEAEVRTLRAHLDQVLEMPDHGTEGAKPVVTAVKPIADTAVAPALPESASANGEEKAPKKAAKKAPAAVVADNKPSPEPSEVEPRPETETSAEA
ncbi:MAG TPA: LapA family protein [Candidatus Limnocylindrales bacterium]|nr:LapA family protein [Candidatus Limnocylindrales bacterium]